MADILKATARAIQSLNIIEDKLRREYGLVGDIGASLSPQITPVIIAGDLRDPGHALNKGRAFVCVYPYTGVGAGNLYWSLNLGAEVLFEGMALNMATAMATGLQIYTTVPGEAVPVAATVQAAAWRDNRTNTNDVPPITAAAAFGALTGTDVSASNRVGMAGSTQPTLIPMSIHVPSGGTLAFRSDTTQTRFNLMVWGRIWP